MPPSAPRNSNPSGVPRVTALRPAAQGLRRVNRVQAFFEGGRTLIRSTHAEAEQRRTHPFALFNDTGGAIKSATGFAIVRPPVRRQRTHVLRRGLVPSSRARSLPARSKPSSPTRCGTVSRAVRAGRRARTLEKPHANHLPFVAAVRRVQRVLSRAPRHRERRRVRDARRARGRCARCRRAPHHTARRSCARGGVGGTGGRRRCTRPTAAFVPTPPLFRIESGRARSFDCSATQSSLLRDRELLFGLTYGCAAQSGRRWRMTDENRRAQPTEIVSTGRRTARVRCEAPDRLRWTPQTDDDGAPALRIETRRRSQSPSRASAATHSRCAARWCRPSANWCCRSTV